MRCWSSEKSTVASPSQEELLDPRTQTDTAHLRPFMITRDTAQVSNTHMEPGPEMLYCPRDQDPRPSREGWDQGHDTQEISMSSQTEQKQIMAKCLLAGLLALAKPR